MIKVSNSSIQMFKSCRRAYELKYIEGITPIAPADALERGRSYHSKVEEVLKGGFPELTDPKIDAMVTAFMCHIAGKIPGAKCVEEWFEKPLSNGNIIVGRCDGILEDGRILEHKTTSGMLDEAYIAGLQNDEQILTYMWAYGVNKMIYTVCKTPTLRQGKNESDDEYYLRCCDWYSEDTDRKVGIVEVERSVDEIAQFEQELCAITEEMEKASLFYRCPSNCMKWGRPCEYFQICRNYDPKMDYIGFERREKA